MRIRRGPNGQPMTIGFNGSEYFFLYNAQGDVVAIANYSGEIVVEYTYDAWGNPLSCTGSLADTLGKKNPFRYRGYVYDEETGLYYLKSRYYDPFNVKKQCRTFCPFPLVSDLDYDHSPI